MSPQRVPLHILTDSLVERVLTEACYVEPEPPQEGMDVDPIVSGSEPSEIPPDMDNIPLMNALERRYTSQAVDWSIAIPPQRIGPSGRLVVPGWVRARAAEVLINDGPDEEDSLPELVLNTLEKVRT